MGGKNSYESVKKYQDRVYDRVLVLFAKGRKEEIKAHAGERGESVNAFINRAVTETMQRDGVKEEKSAAPEGVREG